MNNIEKGAFLKLFNRGGYVLDFSTPDFDAFTMESVGVAICDRYKLSKGKSLISFSNDTSEDLVLKLFADLMEYYEKSYGDFEKETHDIDFNNEKGLYRDLYLKCKNILSKYYNKPLVSTMQAEELKSSFSTEYMTNMINLMTSSLDNNTVEAIGKAKELIESCCKTILKECSVVVMKEWKFQQIVNKAFEELHLLPKDIDVNSPMAASFKQVYGSLKGLINPLAAIRNAYGSGHGKDIHFTELDSRHAKLLVGISCSLTEFLWETHLQNKKSS
jgi:hypothetical protein